MSVQRVLDSDLLVIGGGIAGLFAAIKARAANPDAEVVLVDKSCPGASGCSVFAAGIYPYCVPGEDDEPYAKEIITENSEYLIDQDYVYAAISDSYDRFQDLVNMGVEFKVDEMGRIRRFPALATKYGLCSPFSGGYRAMWSIRAEAVRCGVKLVDRTMITDLLVDRGRCLGAVGFHVQIGELCLLRSRATVLAAGTFYSMRAPMGSSGGTGDGPALALRAGLELRNMEQLGHTTIGPKDLGSPGLHVIFGHGGIMVNAKGERYMERYNPELLEEARRFELARAILREWEAGRGPCYVDCTHLSRKEIEIIESSLPIVVNQLKAKGMSFSKDRIEYIPYGLGLLHVGGTRVNNVEGEVDMEGLWVVGAAGDYCGGADSTVVTTLSGSSIQGARAGRRAAEYAALQPRPDIPSRLISRLQERALKPVEPNLGKGRRPQELTRHLLASAHRYIGLLKSGPNLLKALEEIEAIREETKKVVARDPHELSKVHELLNMIDLLDLSARASSMRTESRRAHFRVDYPRRDDRNWLKWIVARQEEGKLTLSSEIVRTEGWRYKPDAH